MKTNHPKIVVRSLCRAFDHGERVTMDKKPAGQIVRTYSPVKESMRHKLARFKSKLRAMAR